jgi:hypothetical protein
MADPDLTDHHGLGSPPLRSSGVFFELLRYLVSLYKWL